MIPAKPPSKSMRCSLRLRSRYASSASSEVKARLCSSGWALGMFSASHCRRRARKLPTSSTSASSFIGSSSPTRGCMPTLEYRRQTLAMVGDGAEQSRSDHHASQVEVEIVVEGNADSAMHLDTVLNKLRTVDAEIALASAYVLTGSQ